MKVLLVLAALSASGCGVLDFDISQSLPPQDVAGNPVAAAAGNLIDATGLFANPFTFDVDYRSEQKARETGPIDAVRLKAFKLTLDPGSPTQDFDWLEEVHVFIESRRPETTLRRMEIATFLGPQRGKKELDFQVTGFNIKPYVDEGTRVSSEARARVPAANVRFGGTVVFKISPI